MLYKNKIISFLGANDNVFSNILSEFSNVSWSRNKLYIGALESQKDTGNIVVGGPCIRKDIDGISLNSIYQICIILHIAQAINANAIVFLGGKEEIITSPNLSDKYERLANKLGDIIDILSDNYPDVSVTTIRTNIQKYDKKIKEALFAWKIKLTPQESTYLFHIFDNNKDRPLNSPERIKANERILGCHIPECLDKILNLKSNYIFAEDLNQLGCYKYAYNISCSKKSNFSSFIPLPNIKGTKSMFAASESERLLINKSDIYFRNKISQMPKWVIKIYNYALDLILKKQLSFQDKTMLEEKLFIKLISLRNLLKK